MNKLQQIRWSPRGAALLLEVRCAVYNGTLGSGFGRNFQPASASCPPWPSPPDPKSYGSSDAKLDFKIIPGGSQGAGSRLLPAGIRSLTSASACARQAVQSKPALKRSDQ